jgi:nitrate reductase gamma subunit
MYQLATGPLAWASFTIFFVGIIVRAVMYARGLDWQLDRVAYRTHMRDGIRGAARSILRWILPYGTHSWRFYPVFTFFVFLFHVGLLGVALFYEGHNILMMERLGFRLPSMPAFLSDLLTIGVMVAAVFILLRRIALPEVRILTTAYDILLLAIAVAPFFTGFIAAHQVGPYDFWIVAHVLAGEIMLVAIPFTKLSHFILFFMTRAQLGMDYGIKRGGAKSGGFAW